MGSIFHLQQHQKIVIKVFKLITSLFFFLKNHSHFLLQIKTIFMGLCLLQRPVSSALFGFILIVFSESFQLNLLQIRVGVLFMNL